MELAPSKFNMENPLKDLIRMTSDNFLYALKMNKCRNKYIFLGWIICIGLSFDGITPASAEEKQAINIVTPYPTELVTTFQRVFEEMYPDLEVIVLQTRDANQALSHVTDKQNAGVTDLFWASSIEAFSSLKQMGKLQPFRAEVRGIPGSISGIPLHDTDGYFTGFALTGYGYALNERYLKTWRLPAPKRWSDLTQSHYHNHLGMTTPGLSDSTHTIIESILQGGKWQERWYLIKRIAGNLKGLATSPSDVVQGVKNGEFALGMSIDYHGLSMQTARLPVRFIYPEHPTLSAAYIGILKDAPNQEAAKKFIDYLLSRDGQTLLLHQDISRLPIRSDIYKQIPSGYPNPFTDELLKDNKKFDFEVSRQRYSLINVLFDKMITFNFNELKAAVKSIQCLEQALPGHKHPSAEQLLERAIAALSWVPFDEMELEDEDYGLAFEESAALPKWDEATIAEEGIAYDPARWSIQFWANYQQAKILADQGLKLIDKVCH